MIMILRRFLCACLCATFLNITTSFAQDELSVVDSTYTFLKTIQEYQDSLIKVKNQFNTWKYQGEDILANPYYYRLFFQNGLSEDIFKESLGTLDQKKTPVSESRKKYNYINYLIAQTYTNTPTTIKNYLSANLFAIDLLQACKTSVDYSLSKLSTLISLMVISKKDK